MSRRSQRVQNQKQGITTSSAAPEASVLLHEPVQSVTRSKRRPAAKARRIDATPFVGDEYIAQDASKAKRVASTSRKRGKLHQMLNLPLEVMMEICSHVELREVLYLSRLSKAFRALFTSRSTQFIWKSAALNTPDLPPCPEDLNEIAYANLLFDPQCHNCNSKNYFVYWGCRVRLCKKCLTKLYVHSDQYRHDEFHKNDVRSKALFLDRRYNIDELLPPLQINNGTFVHYMPHLKRLESEWKELPQDDLDANRQAFIAEHKRSTRAIETTIPALKKWFDDVRTNRGIQLEDIRQGREDSIVKKLKEDGWELEYDYVKSNGMHLSEFLKLPGVRKTQALSPRIWNTIKGPIYEYMEQIREKRLREIYMNTLKTRVASLEKAVKDVLAEVEGHAVTCWECEACIPKLFDIVDPEKEEFNLGDLHSTLRPLIRDYLGKRYDIALRELSSVLRRVHDLDESADPFSLAIGSLFRCDDCGYVFTPRETVRHVCRNFCSYMRKKPGWMSGDYFAAIHSCRSGTGLNRLKWEADDFTSSLGQASAAIKACGFDVKTATVKDLDEDKNLRLICLNHKSDEYVPIMTWRTAAFHASPCCGNTSSRSSSSSGPRYERATERQVLAAQECEARIKEDNRNSHGYCEFYCAHCSNPPGRSRYDVIRHLATVHHIGKFSEKDWKTDRKDEGVMRNVHLISSRREKHFRESIPRWWTCYDFED